MPASPAASKPTKGKAAKAAVTGKKRSAPSPASRAAKGKKASTAAAAKIEELSVDELLGGDWSDDEDAQPSPAKKQKKQPAKSPAKKQAAAAAPVKGKAKKQNKKQVAEDLSSDDDDDDDLELEEKLDDSEDDEDAAYNPKLHRQQLEELKKTQPEFYKYMQSHGKDLLEFGDEDDSGDDQADLDGSGDDGSEDVEGLDLGEDEEDLELAPESDDEGAADGEADFDKPNIPSADVIKGLDRAMRVQGSWRAVTLMLKHFRTACHSFDDREAGDDRMRSPEEIEFARSRLFMQVLHLSVRDLPRYIVRRAIGGTLTPEKREELLDTVFETYGSTVDEKRAANKSAGVLITQQKNWGKTQNYAKSFVGNLTHLLEHMPNTTETLGLVLKMMPPAVRLASAFPVLGEKLLRALLKIWSGGSERAFRVLAFLRLRELTIAGWSSLMAPALKGVYLAYVRNSKFVSAQTLPDTLFMANCVVEMYGLDPQLSYQQCFIYVRQLAIHLRNALRAPQKDGQRSVYTWKYLNCLRVWSMVLKQHFGVLQALVYPFVQVCLGTMDLLPSARYYPVRYHVCEWLIPLCREARILVPLAPYLTQPVTSTDFAKQLGKSGAKHLDMKFAVKISDSVVKTLQFREQLLDRSYDLLMRYFAVYSYSFAFSELALPTVALLKKFVKTVTVGRMKKRLRLLIARLQANCDWCEARRGQSGLSPKDVAAADIGQWEPLPANSNAAISPMDRYVQMTDAAAAAAAAQEAQTASTESRKRAVAELEQVDDYDHNDSDEGDQVEAMEFGSDEDEDVSADEDDADDPVDWDEGLEGMPADSQELLVLSDSDDAEDSD